MTREIQLIGKNSGTVIVDDLDYEIVYPYRWYGHNSGRTMYAVTYQTREINADKRCIFIHDLIMETPDGLCVDHIDHDGLNCVRSNLRLATHSQNHGNKRKSAYGGTSQYKGVSWDSAYNKWFCSIGYQGKQYFIGRFEDELEAARAYDKKASELFGEFSLLNFPSN